MAFTFSVFILIIFIAGRNTYINQKEKLYSKETNELALTMAHVEHRLEDVELEIRRLVNVMNQMNLLDNPDETKIKSFISDFLFDQYYLSIIIDNNGAPDFKINSPDYQNK